jgi:hypothetical protein
MPSARRNTMPTPMKIGDRTYIGDGVYVEYDGYHIVLKANDPNHPTDKIYLDHHTRTELLRIMKEIDDED